MTPFAIASPQRRSNALVIAAGSLMNDPQVHLWLRRQLTADDLGGVDLYAVETAHVEHVPPSNRLRIALDTDMRSRLRKGGQDVPPMLRRVHIPGAKGSIDANGANSGLAVAEAMHLLSRDFVWPQLERIHGDLMGRARPEDKEFVLYLVLSAASNTGRGAMIPLAVSAARLRDRLVRMGVDASLIGVVMLPGRVDGSGATMRSRFEAQGVASMLELFAYESAIRNDEQVDVYHLGGEPIQVDRCLFDHLIPVSSSRLEPTELSRRAAAMVGMLLADKVGIGERLRTDRVRLTSGSIGGTGPSVTPIGYGGFFLDHAALLNKATLNIWDDLFEIYCSPSEEHLELQLFDGDADAWFEALAREALPIEAVAPAEALGDTAEDIDGALAETEDAAKEAVNLLTRRRPKLIRVIEAALDEALNKHLAGGQPLGDFSEHLDQALGTLDDLATSWLSAAESQPPDLAADVETVNADLRDYADQLTQDVWRSVAASALRDVVRRFRGSIVRNVAATLRQLRAELDEAVMSNRVRLKYFDEQSRRDEIPGLINLWQAPGAYDEFYTDRHPFRFWTADGDTDVDQENLRRFLLPVHDRLVQGFREGRLDEIRGCLRLATELHFQPELDRIQVGHFLKEYARDPHWFGTVLARAVAASDPLVDLKPGNDARDRIFYVEVPLEDPSGDALYQQVCAHVDSPRVKPLKLYANRPFPAVLIVQALPNTAYGELQLLAANGPAMDSFEFHQRAWKKKPDFPIHTDQQLLALTEREIPNLAVLTDRVHLDDSSSGHGNELGESEHSG